MPADGLTHWSWIQWKPCWLSGTNTTSSSSSVGTYTGAVTPSGLTSSDYNISFAAGNLVVTPAASVLTTDLSVASGQIAVGGSASDTAALSGVTATAGGTLEYRFYGTLAACDAATAAFPPAGGGTLVSTVTVSVPPATLAA